MILRKIRRDQMYDNVVLIADPVKHGRLQVHHLMAPRGGSYIIDVYGHQWYITIEDILKLPREQ